MHNYTVAQCNQSLQLTSATVGVYHPLFLLKSISSSTGMLANTVCPFYKINAAPWPTSSASNNSSQRSAHYMHRHRYVHTVSTLTACKMYNHTMSNSYNFNYDFNNKRIIYICYYIYIHHKNSYIHIECMHLLVYSYPLG